MIPFIRAVRFSDKAKILRHAAAGETTDLFNCTQEQFRELPGSPLAYWVGPKVRSSFARFAAVEGENRAVRVGLQTGDDGRFLRCVWEPSLRDRRKWHPFAKGGELLPFFAPLNLVVNWADEGREIRNFFNLSTGKLKSRPQNIEFYFKGGLTWPLRASQFAPQALPVGAIFSVRGYSVLMPRADLLPALAIFNSAPFDYLFKALLGRFGYPEFIVGVLQKLPWPVPEPDVAERLAVLARAAWSHQRQRFTGIETSPAFILPASLNRPAAIDPATSLAEIQGQMDRSVFDLFDFGPTEKREIEGASVFAEAEIDDSAITAEEDALERESESEPDSRSLLSWAVGVAIGRFDIRLATGERPIPPEPDPFDPVPVKSPGMLPEGDAPFMATSGVFVDDPGHGDDLATRVTAVYERVGEVPPAPEDLRRTLAKDYFPAHIHMYSKSRRKAPIYWQLATPSASYSVWLYIHAFSKDTLFRVQNDYVAPKLAHERRELEGLLAEAGPSSTTGQSRAIEAQSNFVEELSALLDEVRRVAPLWDPDLDDGVILNFAPLWRLVPQNRAWQKDLRAAWAALVDGDYDWAHLSMRIWPERVVPKCAKDRSLAIAHDLEDVFWFEDAAGKWQARPTPTRPLDDLIADRTSTAVKAALQSLLDAPDPVAASGRGRRKKS